tara:strand:+ start:11994 stop:13019 length:1026 start_codon:yes stop_codon:yes gene_type:complete
MAVSWSWAWGNEPGTTLDNMEFERPVGGGTQQQTSATTYTYAGSPTRYAWETSPVRTIKFPTKAFINAGTVALPIQAVGSWYAGGSLIQVYSGTSSKSINVYVTNAGAGTISMYVDNVLAGTTTLTASNWHYLALQYDMTGTTWTATLYVDGTSAITGSDTGLAAATSGYYLTGGFGNNALCGQLIVYDTGTAIAVAKTPIYVTRLSPQNDISGGGSWTPAANTGTDAVCAEISNNPFNSATNTTLSPAASTNDMITQATGINGLINATGTTPLAVTAHTYSSGTSVQVKAAVEGGAGGYTVGSTITPDTADTTYAFATYDAVTSGAISSTANINFKYEIV